MRESRRVYVASSWRTPTQPDIVASLRKDGHEVYDFRNPGPGEHGFAWSEIDPEWQQWTPLRFAVALQHPIAAHGFALDFGAMEWANTGVLLLPSGRSAHLEAGYFVGAGKDLFILLSAGQEPELMYRMATAICLDEADLRRRLLAIPVSARARLAAMGAT